MKVEIKIDDKLTDAKLVIYTPELSKEVLALKERLENTSPELLTGFHNDRLELINLDDIVRVYASDKKVYVVTNEKEYLLRIPLYEVENRLNPRKFIRISNSEIINLEKTKNFDLAYVGTISIEMENGDVCYVSRRTLKKVKEILGI